MPAQVLLVAFSRKRAARDDKLRNGEVLELCRGPNSGRHPELPMRDRLVTELVEATGA